MKAIFVLKFTDSLQEPEPEECEESEVSVPEEVAPLPPVSDGCQQQQQPQQSGVTVLTFCVGFGSNLCRCILVYTLQCFS